jgi:kinesin family protein 6/9
VGELVGGSGGSIGRAPDGAKPLVSVKAGEITSPQKGDSSIMANSPKRVVKKGEGGAVPDKNQAFEEFKETDGKDQNRVLKENAASLKDKRQKQKELALTINTCKKQIDDLKVELERRREQVQDGQTDEEEFAIVRSLKGQKAEYRQAFEDLKILKSEADYLTMQVEKARQTLVFDFESWYRASYEDDDGGVDDSAIGGAGGVSAEGEVMDDGEKFDRLEVERVMSEDPDSLAYHNAAKNVFRRTTVGAHGKSKRVKGEANPQPVV